MNFKSFATIIYLVSGLQNFGILEGVNATATNSIHPSFDELEILIAERLEIEPSRQKLDQAYHDIETRILELEIGC